MNKVENVDSEKNREKGSSSKIEWNEIGEKEIEKGIGRP